MEGLGRVWGKEQELCHAGRTLRYVSTPHVAAANLRLSQELEGHEGCINCINFNQKGNLLASGSDDTCVGVWRVEDDAPCALKYKLLAKLDAWHEGNLFGVCFFPHRDDLVASSAADGTVRLSTVDRPTRPLLRGWSDHVGMVHEVAPWGPHTLLSAGDDGRVILRDLRVPVRSRFGQLRVRPTARDELAPPTRPVPTPREALGRSPSGSLYCHRVPKGGVTSMDVHPTRPEYVVLGGRHRYARFLDMRQCFAGSTAAGSAEEERTHRGPSPVVSFLDTAPLQPQNLSRCHVTGVRFSPLGDRIATTSSDGYVLVFDAADPHRAAVECNGHEMDPYTAGSIFVNDQAPSMDHWAADLRPHALPISDEEYPLYFPKEGLQSWNFRWMSVQARDWLDSGAPAPREDDDGDEGHMESDAPASHEQQVAKVAPRPPALRGILHTQTVKEVGWLGPRGEFVVAGSSCGHVLLWDTTAEGMPLVRAMKADNHIANCVRSHPDQHRYMLATAGIDNELRLWCPGPGGSHWGSDGGVEGQGEDARGHERHGSDSFPPRSAYAVGRRALKHPAESSRRGLQEVDEQPPEEEGSTGRRGRMNFAERLRELLNRSGIVITSATDSGSEDGDGEGEQQQQQQQAAQGGATRREGSSAREREGNTQEEQSRGGRREESAAVDDDDDDHGDGDVEDEEGKESPTSPAEVPAEDTSGPRTQETVEDDDDDEEGGRGGRETPPSPRSVGSARSAQQQQEGGEEHGEGQWVVASVGGDSDDDWDDWRPDGEANAIGTVLSAQRLYELTKRNEERTVARGDGMQASLRAQFDLLQMLLRMRNPNQAERG